MERSQARYGARFFSVTMKVEEPYDSLVTAMDQDHRRLVRLCARLSGQADAAEDLAQETLVEAWRNRHKWTGSGSAYAWLSRIALNICWRWRRFQGRERERIVATSTEDMEGALPALDWENELEQKELLDVLDRALSSLPRATRDLLIAKYVEDAPLTELSGRLGAAPGTVAVRLHRGRQALQKVVLSQFREDAVAYGLIAPESAAWTATRLWCGDCGRARLQVSHQPHSHFMLRCPRCYPLTRQYFEYVDLSTGDAQKIVGEASSLRVLQTRLDSAGYRYCRRALDSGEVHCAYCGKPNAMECRVPGDGFAAVPDQFALALRCQHCSAPLTAISLGRWLLGAPEIQQFWRQNPRLRRLPDKPLLVQGVPAVLTRFESVEGRSAVELISRQSDFALIEVRSGAEVEKRI